MKKFFLTAAAGTLMFLLAGCAADLALSDSDLTVRELEQKMAKAVDPQGRFAAARCFIQRFEVKTFTGLLEPPKEEFMEVKFALPGKFKITTSDDKGLHYGYIFNDESGYMVDYRQKSIKPLDKELLDNLRTMREVADPVMNLSSVFSIIEIRKGISGEKSFYRLRCRKTSQSDPLDFFISARDYRLRSLTGRLKIGSAVLNYSSTVVKYALAEGITVADTTKSNTNGIKTESKLVYFKLDPYFSPDEFKIPVF